MKIQYEIGDLVYLSSDYGGRTYGVQSVHKSGVSLLDSQTGEIFHAGCRQIEPKPNTVIHATWLPPDKERETIGDLGFIDAIVDVDDFLYQVRPEDIEVQSYSSKNTAWANKVPDGIRIVHKPTNTVVVCEKHRAQHQNKAEAMAELRRILGLPAPAH